MILTAYFLEPYDKSIFTRENHVKQLHSVLLKFSSKDTAHRGNYKQLSNNVVAFDADGKEIGIVFETASPFETPREMEKLVGWLNQSVENKTIHPLLITAVFVVCFLAIHPYSGRKRQTFADFDDLASASFGIRICAIYLA